MYCKDCEKEKTESEFYKSYKAICKECVKNKNKKNRKENIEKAREYDRNRPNKKERVEKNKQRLQFLKENNIEKYKKIQKQKREWEIKNKEKKKAHSAVARALMTGKITRPNKCEICKCNDKEIEAHHYDYTKPLNVQWLCIECHNKQHKKDL